MLRLAIEGVDEAVRQALGCRLRRAVVVPDGRGAEAIALVESPGPGSSDLDAWSNMGKPLLVPMGLFASVTNGGGNLASSETAARLAVWNPARFLTSIRLIRQQLDAGKLGIPGLLRLHRWEPPAVGRRPRPWQSSLLYEMDLVLWLMKSEPDLVYATRPDPVPSESGTMLQIHLGFPGGGMALVDWTDSLPAGDAYSSLCVIGSAGAAYADDHQNRQLLFRGGPATALATDEGIVPLACMLQEFVDAVLAGSDFAPSLASLRMASRLVGLVERSLRVRQAIAWEGY